MNENWFTQIARGITRPAVTIIFSAVIAHAVIEGIALPQWFLGLALPLIVWWFGERAVTHVQERKYD